MKAWAERMVKYLMYDIDITPCMHIHTYIHTIIYLKTYILFCIIFQRVSCLLRKVVQEIERRISTQAEHLRTVRLIISFSVDYFVPSLLFFLFIFGLQQNNLFKTREEKYQSRIRVLEALANGTSGETKVVVLMYVCMYVCTCLVSSQYIYSLILIVTGCN